MDITFVLCPNLIGLMGLSILLIFTRFNFYLDEQRLRLFITTAVMNMAIIVFEVADYLLGESSFPSAYLWRRITSAAGFALTPVLPMLLCCISRPRAFGRLFFLPAIANAVMSFASIFTGHMFHIDAGNSYFRGPLFLVMVAISVFYLAAMLYIAFSGMRRLRRSESVFLLGMGAAILMGNLLEILWSFHFVIWNTCAVLLITYYLFLHIQYFKFDPLTGVFNRNMFMHEVSTLAHKTGVGAVSFDLNGLKQINDQQGHAQGDAYIIHSAHLIERCFAETGRLYRIGGDEFVVLMTGTTEKTIEDMIAQFEQTSRAEGVSVACGYSFTKAVEDASQMLRDADKAMYDNKRGGRDRCL